MGKASGKRLIIELVATCIASPLLMLLLLLVRAGRVLVWIEQATFQFRQAIASQIEKIFPPDDGGWFKGLGTAIIVDFVLTWILLWVVLFAIVRLVEVLIERKKREA